MKLPQDSATRVRDKGSTIGREIQLRKLDWSMFHGRWLKSFTYVWSGGTSGEKSRHGVSFTIIVRFGGGWGGIWGGAKGEMLSEIDQSNRNVYHPNLTRRGTCCQSPSILSAPSSSLYEPAETPVMPVKLVHVSISNTIIKHEASSVATKRLRPALIDRPFTYSRFSKVTCVAMPSNLWCTSWCARFRGNKQIHLETSHLKSVRA